MAFNGNGGWRNVVIAVLSSIVITGTTAWFVLGADTVRRDELTALNANVQQLERTVAKLETTVAVLAERVGTK